MQKRHPGEWGKRLFVLLFLLLCTVPYRLVPQNTAIGLRAHLLASLFATSGTDQVIVGKDGWLFYGETADDFSGQGTLTDGETDAILDRLEAARDLCRAHGAQFIVLCVPDKNTVYPQYMPDRYLAAPVSQAERLYAGMRERDILGPDLLALFRADGRQLYHKRDSHWNNRGAALCAEAVMQLLAREPIPFIAMRETVRTDFEGDLDAMLYPGEKCLDEQVYYDYDFTYRYETRLHSLMDMEIRTACPDARERVLVMRDSFGNALLPFLAEQFAEGCFTRTSDPNPPESACETGVDVVIFEIAERNLRYIIGGM